MQRKELAFIIKEMQLEEFQKLIKEGSSNKTAA
jgi:hypothetical protein